MGNQQISPLSCVGWTVTCDDRRSRSRERGEKGGTADSMRSNSHHGQHLSPKKSGGSFHVSPLSVMLETDELSDEPSSAGSSADDLTRDTEIEESIEDDASIAVPALELEDDPLLADPSFLQSPNPQIRPLSARRLSASDVPLLPLPSPVTVPSNSQMYSEPDTPFDTISVGESISSIIPLCSPLSEMTLDSTHQQYEDEGVCEGGRPAVKALPASPKLPPTHLSRRFRKTVSNVLASNFPRLYQRKSDRRVVTVQDPPTAGAHTLVHLPAAL